MPVDDVTNYNKKYYLIIILLTLKTKSLIIDFANNHLVLQVTFQRMTIPNHYIWLYNSKKIMYMVK